MFNLNDYSKKPLYKDIQLLEIDNNGDKEWWLNGKRHREDGPAVEWANGSKEWFLNGKRHRVDGPAIEWADGTKEWFLNGKKLTEQKFNQRNIND